MDQDPFTGVFFYANIHTVVMRYNGEIEPKQNRKKIPYYCEEESSTQSGLGVGRGS